MSRIGVLGIGNVLMGDDALGPWVIKVLEAEYEPAPGVDLVELGTPGADLSLHLEGLDAAVVVDAVRTGGAPGEVSLLDRAQLLAGRPVTPGGPHDPGLREALFTLDFGGRGPRDVRLVGVVPQAVRMAVGLSAPVREALPAAVEAVVAQLSDLGVPLRRRATARAPDVWWERPGSTERPR